MNRAHPSQNQNTHSNKAQSRDTHKLNTNRLAIKDPRDLLSLCLVAIGYIISIIAYGLNGRTLLDADESAEMVLANHLNETGRFLSRDWFYSTELRVLNTQIINKLALAIFPRNWHAARTLAIAILVLILLASYLYLVHVAELGWIGNLTALALVVPFSTTYSYIVLYGSFYVPHVAITFVLLALTIQILKSSSDKKRWIYLCVACVLSLVAGLGGVRQFLVFHAPLFLTAFVLLFIEKHSEDSMQAILKSEHGHFLLVSIAEAFFCVLGVGINSVILHRFYTFSEYTKTSLNSLKLSAFLDYLGQIIHIWGYEGCAELRDITGAAAICGLMLCAIFLLVTVFCIHRFRSLNRIERIFLLFFVFGVFTNVVFYLFANLPVPRYLMPAAIMVLPLIPVALRQKDGFGRPWQTLLLAVFVFCMFVQSTNYFWYYAYRDKGMVPTQEEKVASWLVENNYTKGLGTFWNSAILTELSNGRIEMWNIQSDNYYSDWSSLELYEWLQVKSHRDALPTGPVFLIVNSDEIDAINKHPYMTAVPAFSTGKYTIFTFDSTDDMFMELAGVTAPELTGSRR